MTVDRFLVDLAYLSTSFLFCIMTVNKYLQSVSCTQGHEKECIINPSYMNTYSKFTLSIFVCIEQPMFLSITRFPKLIKDLSLSLDSIVPQEPKHY